MEFWGQEVKPGTTVSCKAGDGFVIHLSQAALGETKKGSENVVVSVKVNDKKLVIGTLSAEKHPQTMCDLIFDQEFELSHSSKTTSVFLCGYKSQIPDMFESDSGEDEDVSDEELKADKIPMTNNAIEKSAAKVAPKDIKKDQQDDDDDGERDESDETSIGDDDLESNEESSGDADDDDEKDESDETSSGDADSSDDLESDEEFSSSEEEETPEKPQVGKKRAGETATPASDKKAKIATPSGQKTGEKGGHVATPHPAKQANKTPADSKSKDKAPKTPADSKSKEKSPKSGSHACKSCSKTFGSAGALESHQKAKNHEA
uniref:Hda106 n=1 Tax=Arundo donax TaxID=35708 RepID=A0A0A9DR33_ARUDO